MTATQWLEILASYPLQVLVVVGVASALDRRVADCGTRSSVWSMCFWSILSLACLAVVLPRLHLVRPWSALQPHALLPLAETQVVVGRLLLCVWSLGAAGVLLGWIKRGFVLHRVLHRCEVLSAAESRRLLATAQTAPAADKSPRLLVSDEIDGPFCWQLHEPLIVLPRFLLAGTDDDLAHVLAHEWEHLRTNHPLQLFLQHAVQVVCWFHPYVWRCTRHVSLVREFACDDAAVAVGADTAAYLRTLLRIAERCEEKHATLGFGRNRSDIVVRSRRLVERVRHRATVTRRGLGRPAAVVVMLIATFASSQLWLPVDVLASSRSAWSPWPSWTARSLHVFGIAARDYERFEHRSPVYELREEARESFGDHD